jgi:hypothetical protein
MIRFMPDTWVDVLMRPLDMISPEANLYVEVAAPDIRLAAAILLGVIVLACWRRAGPQRRPVLQVLALTILAMVPWLATTGNGRYFIPFLLVLGPLCIGLVRLLPLTRSMQFGVVGLLLLVQGVLIVTSAPLGTWALSYWRDGPYFPVSSIPAQPRSYVTLTPISYSLIAPLFPEQSRWMSASAPVSGPREREYERQWLAQARSLYLLAPSYPSQVLRDGQPSALVLRVFNKLIAPRGLSIPAGARCEFLRSAGFAGMAFRFATRTPPEEQARRFGFWVCPLNYAPESVAPPAAAVRDVEMDPVFEAVERLCPRFFPAGEAKTERVEGGATRSYMDSDTRVYVLDDGEVLYKFWRSLNPVTIGQRADVLAGRVQLDCSKIRAPTWRSGGP